jgi:hypothetical protein
MGRQRHLWLSFALAVVCSGIVQATDAPSLIDTPSLIRSDRASSRNDPVPVSSNVAADIHVEGITFVLPPADAPQPSSLLQFIVVNDSAAAVSDLVISVTVKETPPDEDDSPRTLVGPFAVAGHATIEVGYSVEYSLLLRNLMPDCHCRADVQVTSARPASEPAR